MKLSKLVYLVVKNVKYLDDDGFLYEAFINGDFLKDPDYKNSIVNAMTPINEAIHRLSDRNKIAFKTYNVGLPNNNQLKLPYAEEEIIDPDTEETEIIRYPLLHIKKIVSVFYLYNNEYATSNFREIDKDTIWIGDDIKVNHNIQYVEDIEDFDLEPIFYKDLDPELKDFGISNTMCDYMIEYAQGKLQEIIAPELANLHLTHAEQYFSDLEDQQTAFTKNHIKRKYSI